MTYELIFEYTDEDDDRLKVRKCQDYTIFRAEDIGGDEVEVRLRRENVTALHAALGEWLGQADVTATPILEDSPIDQLIVRRVAEEVARVLPLHRSPLADNDPEPGEVGHPVEPEHEDCPCDHRPGVRQPSKYEDASALWGPAGEPPRAASKPKPYCDGCLHSWARHPGGGLGCNAVRTAESGRPYCGCKQVRP